MISARFVLSGCSTRPQRRLDLQQTMDEGRRRRLAYIGFPAGEAAELSALHTRSFM
jgi:hypothetical protein